MCATMTQWNKCSYTLLSSTTVFSLIRTNRTYVVLPMFTVKQLIRYFLTWCRPYTTTRSQFIDKD